jgi:hypothetical protein
VTLRARWVTTKSSLGDAKSSLGDAKSWVTLRARLGDAPACSVRRARGVLEQAAGAGRGRGRRDAQAAAGGRPRRPAGGGAGGGCSGRAPYAGAGCRGEGPLLRTQYSPRWCSVDRATELSLCTFSADRRLCGSTVTPSLLCGSVHPHPTTTNPISARLLLATYSCRLSASFLRVPAHRVSVSVRRRFRARRRTHAAVAAKVCGGAAAAAPTKCEDQIKDQRQPHFATRIRPPRAPLPLRPRGFHTLRPPRQWDRDRWHGIPWSVSVSSSEARLLTARGAAARKRRSEVK